jgi:hypothetical protein
MQRQSKQVSIRKEGLLGGGILTVISVRGPCQGVILKRSEATGQLRELDQS